MKIAFDAQLLFEEEKTGIGRTSKMIIDEMIKDKNNEYQLNCFRVKKSQKNRQIIQKYKMHGCMIKMCPWISAPVYNHLERIFPIPYKWLFGKSADITQFFNYAVPFGVGTKCSTFIYDMAYKACPHTTAKRTRRWLGRHIKNYCSRADIILTVSQFSKQEILRYLPVRKEKVHVLYLGVDKADYHASPSKTEIISVKEKYHIAGDYILYLGTLEPRKNIERLLAAYIDIKTSHSDFPKLVLAGKKGWLYQTIFDLAKEYNLQDDIIFTGYIEEKDTPILMGGATMFVFPSLYEGFGIPPLEAMACGTPVITSNTASLPEVVGDAGIMVDPYSDSDLRDCMLSIYADEELRKRLHCLGIQRAKEFTWEKAAKQLVKIYKEMKTVTENANY